MMRWQFRGEPGRRPSRAAYALPTFFTAANIFLGFTSILKSYSGVISAARGQMGPNHDFEVAAQLIGVAILTDGLDGRIARMTNTVSDFGREMDSLADVITFGLAPAVLAYAWGVQFADAGASVFRENLSAIGYFIVFLYALCGAARLARFNVVTNPIPTNPGRPDRKYFVGLPIPAAAGLVASVVYAGHSIPIQNPLLSTLWLLLLGLLAFLMVSTWRYRSFKDLALVRPRSPLTIVFVGALIFLIWNYSRSMLLSMGVLYVGSGIVVRLGGIAKRLFRSSKPQPA